MSGWYILIGIAVIVILIILWAIGAYNGLVKLAKLCEEAFSTMDVYLKKRFDLIPNLVETVKGYTKHESETFENIVKARNAVSSATTPAEELKAQGELTQTLGRLFALTEAYPELKANTNFIDLQTQLQKIEEDIANARKYYNGVVTKYNTKIATIPTNIIASIGHFTAKPLFEVSEASERENVKVQF